ncbi:hypothetical protein [Xanthomonas vesicatoria]|uniref:Uncharacterized protein n=1 Tax=Xanthomonas vesicatoria ATCC 35937 TaxID=925775 RepID=F0BBX7_9XANT|nr:hypothetical protein [Xanthomonas vesicatoria]APP74142.1 hypothetical protein BJD12_01405 [Xanthomonas vesicatoria ATCC 35937]EGD10119.1 hypothetical protein XVE_1601 [Xanthomonas vesicatoria ATCC 35937]KTF35598.1 hypothetical protein LMG920_02110 [Xanthomonas vesicatoria]MCC8595423.1 hypothetical protein [Xanthomonas vesicatoria]MCC8604207.1 hypothetical protein [Xanthomonas vesicatoria]
MTLLASTIDADPTAALEAAALATAHAARIAQSEAAKPVLRRVRLPAALHRLELAARAEVKALINPRRDCSEDALLFATVAWDLGLDGDAVSASGR